MLATRRSTIVLAFLICSVVAYAKSTPIAVANWPSTGTPLVRFTFGKFKSLPGMGVLHAYVMDTTAENLSTKLIPSAVFSIYLFDKHKVRVGQDTITLTNVGPGETVRFQTTVMVSDQPVSVEVQQPKIEPKSISLTVNSSPQGAVLKVDGKEVGTTPRLIYVGPGHHTLSFIKDGFRAGDFSLQIGSDDVSGGTVSYDLGAAALDTIELRDGSVLTGDLISISGMDVEVRVGGSLQHIDRNQIQRILLTQREEPQQTQPSSSSTSQ